MEYLLCEPAYEIFCTFGTATGEDPDESSQQMMARPNKRTEVGPHRITNKAILHITRRRIGAWTYGPIKNDVIISGHLSEIDN